MKEEMFVKELSLIKDESLRNFAVKALSVVPEYFFSVPASSTGKYHPSYTLGEGGLTRHVRAGMRIAVELFRLDLWGGFTDHEKDLILISLLLHDAWKSGTQEEKSQWTLTEHPLIASRELKKNFLNTGDIAEEDLKFICWGIETHMGKWVNDFKSGEKVLDPPNNRFQRFIHLADYLASIKCLNMDFDVPLSTDN